MTEEMESLTKNKTWTMVTAPPGTRVLQNRWIFKIKPRTGDFFTRYKASLVVNGFSQRPGIEYHETFSPVVKFPSIRAILAVAATSDMHLVQFDIKTAFLNGDLEEEIFISQSEGYDDGSGQVYKLQKALYGLKQSARSWNKSFMHCLAKFDLRVSQADPCVFVTGSDKEKLVLAVYIDDDLVAS